MQPLLIKFALRAKGITMTDLARSYISPRTQAPVSEKSIRCVVEGLNRSAGIERCIAKALGLPIQDIFPQWYSPTGKRLRKRYRPVSDALARLQQIEANAPKREAA